MDARLRDRQRHRPRPRPLRGVRPRRPGRDRPLRRAPPRGGAGDVREGSWSPQRLVVLEFPGVAAAQAWWESDEYSELRALRERASDAELVITEGLAAT